MKQIIYITLGTIFVGIGAIGIILPVLPTTIFLIIASLFFVRSSPKLHKKLMNSKTFGPLISNYINHRGITKKDRIKSLTTIWMLIIISMIFVQNLTLILILLIVAIAHTVYFYRLKLLLN